MQVINIKPKNLDFPKKSLVAVTDTTTNTLFNANVLFNSGTQLFGGNVTVESIAPTNYAILNKKPKMKDAILPTFVYALRNIQAGQWMGSPFLTYPNQLEIPRP